jgi:hypothetical protein
VSGIESSYEALAAERGLEAVGTLGVGPLTPLLYESGDGSLRPAYRDSATVLGQLAYKRNKTFRFNLVIAEVPASTAFVPRLFCIHKGRSTRDDEFYGFEARDTRLWTESTVLNERYRIATSPFQDPNWMRQLFSPAFVDFLASRPPADFSFELAYGTLCCSVEEDDPGAEGLAALADAAAEVADRIKRECEE